VTEEGRWALSENAWLFKAEYQPGHPTGAKVRAGILRNVTGAFAPIGPRVGKLAVAMSTILLIILILLVIGALPTWPHSAGWGYYPSGGLGVLLVILLVLVLLGRV